VGASEPQACIYIESRGYLVSFKRVDSVEVESARVRCRK